MPRGVQEDTDLDERSAGPPASLLKWETPDGSGADSTRTPGATGVTLRRRLYSLLLRWFVLFLVISGIVTFLAFAHFRKTALEQRLLLARTIAHYLDSSTSTAIQGLGRLARQLPSLDSAAESQMRSFRFQCLFRAAIYVANAQGKAIVSDPPFALTIPPRLLTDRETITPLVQEPQGDTRPLLAAVQPFRRDEQQYYLVAEMNPLGSAVSTFLQDLGTRPGLHIFVVDVNGVVIAAPDQKQLFRLMGDRQLIGERIRAHRPLVAESTPCTVCAEQRTTRDYLTVMAPLRFAPWGVVIQEHQRAAFEALYTSQSGFLAAGALLVLMGFFLSRALLKSVVAPIQTLSRQAERLRRGDLTSPIGVEGDREIDVLATTMEAARQRLAATLDELQTLNENLERKVARRTRALRDQYELLVLQHEVAQFSTRERDPERFIPQILRVIAEHYSFEVVGLVTTPPDAPPVVYHHPQDAALPWLRPGISPPEKWTKLALEYRGSLQAELFHPQDGGRGEVVDSVCQQIAMSLHATYLAQRALLQDEQRRVLVQRLLSASEEERRRLARELHDEISQLLTVIQLSLEEVSLDTPAIRKARDLLSRTQQEVHRIIYDLRPSLLDDLGLPAAMRWYGENYLREQGLQVSLDVEEELTLPAEIQLATFRIFQEIVTNVLRHSQAENISIELYEAGGELVLAVEDDGVGFDPREKFAGIGLVGMRERAALVGGTITFDSSPGTGTQVVLKIPVKS